MLNKNFNEIIIEDIKRILSANLPWQNFKNKTILISGANGFLPAYIVKTLLFLNLSCNYNMNIIALVRNQEKAVKRFSDYIDRKDFQIIVQDVCKPINFSDNIDYIIHAASQASPNYYGSDPVGTLMANTIGTYNLLELARQKKVSSFLFFSSGEVYGEVTEEQIPTSENVYGYLNPLNVRCCYAESKRMGENMCVSWFHQYNVPAKIVRPFHTYGPGMNLNDGRVFADFVSNIVNNQNIILNSDGSATRAFCYLADATLGFFTILLNGNNAEAYNIGNNFQTSILELANILINLYPEKKLKIVFNDIISKSGYIKSSIKNACPDITKANNLGWKPETTIFDGFKRTVESFS